MKYVKTYESFLFENHAAKSDGVIKELNRLLALNKERDANVWDIFEIPGNWTVYDKATKVPKTEMMEPSQCFQNALDYSKKTGAPCIVGGFIDKNSLGEQTNWMDSGDENKFGAGFVFYPHAFNLDDKGNVYDVTLYNDPNRWVYVGIEIDPNKFDRGLAELLPHLNKLLKRKV